MNRTSAIPTEPRNGSITTGDEFARLNDEVNRLSALIQEAVQRHAALVTSISQKQDTLKTRFDALGERVELLMSAQKTAEDRLRENLLREAAKVEQMLKSLNVLGMVQQAHQDGLDGLRQQIAALRGPANPPKRHK